MKLDRNAILAAHDVRTQSVDIPEWGGSAFVRVLTGAERDSMEAEISANKGKVGANFRARFTSLILCDENGVRLFSEKDAVALASKSGLAMDRVIKAGMLLNQLDAGEVEKAVGESGGVQS